MKVCQMILLKTNFKVNTFYVILNKLITELKRSKIVYDDKLQKYSVLNILNIEHSNR